MKLIATISLILVAFICKAQDCYVNEINDPKTGATVKYYEFKTPLEKIWISGTTDSIYISIMPRTAVVLNSSLSMIQLTIDSCKIIYDGTLLTTVKAYGYGGVNNIPQITPSYESVIAGFTINKSDVERLFTAQQVLFAYKGEKNSTGGTVLNTKQILKLKDIYNCLK